MRLNQCRGYFLALAFHLATSDADPQTVAPLVRFVPFFAQASSQSLRTAGDAIRTLGEWIP